MKQLKFLAMMLAMTTICLVFTACGNEDDDGDLPYNNVSYYDNSQIYHTLVDKTWQYIGCEYYDSDRNFIERDDYTEKMFLFYFSSIEAYPEEDVSEVYFVGKETYTSSTSSNIGNHIWSIDWEGYIRMWGNYAPNGYVVDLSSNEFKLLETLSGTEYKYKVNHFKLSDSSLNTGSGSNTGGGDTGGSSTYEIPEIGYYSFTAYPTKLTVDFKIYNQDEAKVSSAKGYYGTSAASNSTSATVVGTIIRLNISGLQKNTKYKVKCTGTGPGGTGTSDVVTLMTTE